MKSLNNEIGAFIREARERKGLNQADIAEMLGVSRSHYAFIESGRRGIYFTKAVNICRVLDLDINDLIKYMK